MGRDRTATEEAGRPAGRTSKDERCPAAKDDASYEEAYCPKTVCGVEGECAADDGRRGGRRYWPRNADDDDDDDGARANGEQKMQMGRATTDDADGRRANRAAAGWLRVVLILP